MRLRRLLALSPEKGNGQDRNGGRGEKILLDLFDDMAWRRSPWFHNGQRSYSGNQRKSLRPNCYCHRCTDCRAMGPEEVETDVTLLTDFKFG